MLLAPAGDELPATISLRLQVPGIAGTSVRALGVYNGELYAGGEFGLPGGTVVPDPQLAAYFLTDLSGEHRLDLRVPPGMPVAVPVFAQALMLDPAAPQGVAFGNAIHTVSQ